MSGLRASEALLLAWRETVRADGRDDADRVVIFVAQVDEGSDAGVELRASATLKDCDASDAAAAAAAAGDAGHRLDHARALIDARVAGEACYALVDVGERPDQVSKSRRWLFVYCLPPRLPVRQRMLYSSTLEGTDGSRDSRS